MLVEASIIDIGITGNKCLKEKVSRKAFWSFNKLSYYVLNFDRNWTRAG